MDKTGYILLDDEGYSLTGDRYKVGIRYHSSKPITVYSSIRDAVMVSKSYNNANIAAVTCYNLPDDKKMRFKATELLVTNILTASSIYRSMVIENELRKNEPRLRSKAENDNNRIYFQRTWSG